MRNILIILPILSSCVASALFSHAIPLGSSYTKQQQAPMVEQGPGIALPDSGKPLADVGDSAPDAIIISDVLGRDRSISIFASLVRDVDTVAQRLQNGELNATVLAPTNAEMAKLPRKPWEDAQDYETFGTAAYRGSDGEDRAARNLRRFVEAHIVPRSPWGLGDKVEALAGNTMWVEEQDGKILVQPGNVEMSSVADKVSNGEVWILKGVVNYAQ